MELNLKIEEYSKKKFNDKFIKIKKIISDKEKFFILDQIQQSYVERLKENEEIVPLIIGLDGDIELLICTLSTKDIEIQNYSYSELLNSGFINFIKENVINYEDIRKSCYEMINMIKINDLIPDLSQFNTTDSTTQMLSEILSSGKSAEEIAVVIQEFKDFKQKQYESQHKPQIKESENN